MVFLKLGFLFQLSSLGSTLHFPRSTLHALLDFALRFTLYALRFTLYALRSDFILKSGISSKQKWLLSKRIRLLSNFQPCIFCLTHVNSFIIWNLTLNYLLMIYAYLFVFVYKFQNFVNYFVILVPLLKKIFCIIFKEAVTFFIEFSF